MEIDSNVLIFLPPSSSAHSQLPWAPDALEGLLEAGTVSKSAIIAYLQSHAQPVHVLAPHVSHTQVWLQLWRLVGSRRVLSHTRNPRQLVAAYRDFVQSGEHAVGAFAEPMELATDVREKVRLDELATHRLVRMGWDGVRWAGFVANEPM